MGFYIIEINDKYKQVVLLSAEGELYCKDVAGLMPYIEPDLEQVRKEAYDEGYDDAKGGYENGFENGMIVAWEACRKIGCYEIDGGYPATQMLDLFDRDDLPKILSDYTAAEAIEKLKAYEQEQNEIKVGDEVAFRHDYGPDIVVVVTYIGQDGFIDCMDGRGSQYAHKNPKRCTKTGRSFPEIAAVLEKMKEGQE